MRAAIYTRISNDPTGRAAGVERQEADCVALAAREGWEVVGVFRDNDVSATARTPRKAYRAVLEAVRSGTAQAILVWHIDRLYRRPEDLKELIDLVEGGVLPGGIRTVQAGDLDLNTASGRLIARLLVDVSLHEVERTQERLRAMNQHAAKQGRRVGGRRPFGYEIDGHTIRESEAAVYREMVEAVLSGRSLRSLVASLNGRGIDTAAGRPFSMRAARDVLRNPRYAGKRTYLGDPLGDATWPRLVTPETHARLVRLLEDPARRSTPGPDRRHYLAGVATCGRCGTRLRSMRSGGQSAYGCPPSTAGGCGGVRIVAGPVEEHVRAAVFEALADPRITEALNVAVQGGSESAVLAELDSIDLRIAEAADAFAVGEIDRSQLVRATAGLRARRAALQAELRPAVAAVISAPDVAAVRWAEDVEYRTELTRAMFDVIVHPAPNPGDNRVDLTRVELRGR